MMDSLPHRLWALPALLALALLVPSPALGQSSKRPDRAAAERALQRVKDLRNGVGVRTGREVSPAMRELARQRSALGATERRQADALLQRPTTNPNGDGFVDYSVTEATPYCTANFCVHYVTSTADAPSLTDTTPANGIPDYVETMAAEFEFTYSIENGDTGLNWNDPPSDGTVGNPAGNSTAGLTDVYIAQIGDQGIYGYANTDPGQSGNSQFGYQVMDDDYVEFSPTPPLTALRVTAAHEYNHVLQFGYDTIQDSWMFESTATWAEEKVYPAGDDYLLYLPNWASCTESPLTFFSQSGCGQKVYGSAVWNHWLEWSVGAEPDVIRDAWASSLTTTPQSFAPGAFGASIVSHGNVGFGDEFGKFAAAVAEWQASDSPFPDHAAYPDVERIGTSMTVGGGSRTVQLDHTTFELINVTVPASGVATLEATAPAGTRSAIALVGRTGTAADGTTTKVIQQLPTGGAGTVTLPSAASFSRITAVIVNSDTQQSGFNSGQQDWNWDNDNQNYSNVRVTATDPSGPPDTTISSGPTEGSTTGANVSFSFTATDAGATFECRLDSAPDFTTCTSPQNLTLASGAHTFRVRAVNGNGPDATPAQRAWTVDATPPNTTIDTGPTGTVSSNDATFTFSSTEPTGATFKCKLDTEPGFTSCSSPKTYNDLADGSHTFEVKATDQYGNEDGSADSQTWTIDAPPDANITSGPADPTNATAAVFNFTATEGDATFQCKLDGGSFAPCTSGTDFGPVGAGSHTFQVKAIDGVSSLEGPIDTHTWTVDLTAPDLTVVGPDNGVTTGSDVSFDFSSTDGSATFMCRLGSGSFAPCTSPQALNDLADGAYSFDVKSRDAAGNESAVDNRTFTVDDPPEAQITSGPPAFTNSQGATFHFSYANEPGAGFECRRDGASFTACSSPKSYSTFAEGAHTFEVRALDAADNGPGAAASRGWTVDVTPPNTAITSGPSGTGNGTTANFDFNSSEASSTFRCALDSASFTGCLAPLTLSGLSSGAHTLSVQAWDQAGNFDASPASRSWTVGTPVAPPAPPPVAPPPPPPVAPPPPPAVPFTLGVTAPSRRSFATAFFSGVKAGVTCSSACSGAAELLLDRRTAKRLKIKQRIGRKTFKRTSAGRSSVAVKVSRTAQKALSKLRSVKVTLRVKAADPAGASKTASKKISLKR